MDSLVRPGSAPICKMRSANPIGPKRRSCREGAEVLRRGDTEGERHPKASTTPSDGLARAERPFPRQDPATRPNSTLRATIRPNDRDIARPGSRHCIGRRQRLVSDQARPAPGSASSARFAPSGANTASTHERRNSAGQRPRPSKTSASMSMTPLSPVAARTVSGRGRPTLDQ